MKKLIRLFIISCLIITCLIPNVAFASVETKQVDWEDIALSDKEFNEILSMNPNNNIQPLATGLITYSSIGISKSGSTLIIAGITKGSSEVTQCGFKKVTIERRKNSSSGWSSYLTYENLYIDGRSYQLSKRVAVPTGYQYRVSCTHYAKKNILSTQKIDKTSNILTF